jgi:hypothetical protein
LGDFEITRSNFVADTLALTVESYDDEGSVRLTPAAAGLTGRLVGFGENARLELRRTGPPSPIVRPVLSLPPEKWREDLRYLASELPQKHKNAFHRVSREQFERAVAELDARIPTLQQSDVVMELSRIVAMIGDGHTNLGWGGLFPRVPLQLFWFGNQLRVTATTDGYRRALGARVVEIGGVSIDEAFRRDRPYISQGETPEFVLNANAHNMTSPARLHVLGLAPDATRATYTFEDERAKRFTLEVKAEASEKRLDWIDAAGRTPLYRQRENEPVWYTYLPETRTIYVNFSGYLLRRAFGERSRELFAFIDRQPADRIVIDMRNNGGGDFNRGREFIVAGFKQRPAVSARGRLFVVVGRRTFSAGMVNAADFRRELNAIIVGEPTGQRPNSFSENRGFSLPNSHLGVSYSTQYYKIQDADTPGLIPDLSAGTEWADYKQGRDGAMERILASSGGK